MSTKKPPKQNGQRGPAFPKTNGTKTSAAESLRTKAQTPAAMRHSRTEPTRYLAIPPPPPKGKVWIPRNPESVGAERSEQAAEALRIIWEALKLLWRILVK